MKSKDIPFFAAALLAWAVVWSVMAATLPLFTVDETRYLSVAWEMRQHHNWLLPTINGLPYSHKPPLLFWLVNIMWTIFGTHVWPARVVQLLATAGAVIATRFAAQTLFPKDKVIADIAPLLLLACPPFMVYGSLIMFDMMMTVWVTLGIAVLWELSENPSRKLWLKWGVLLGLGLITKGPVVLIYLAVPALAAPLWKEPESKPDWYRGVLFGIFIGAVIVLCWAIPAAIAGGPEFAKMIFLKQSAGRMVNAFDHARPPWFYIPLLAVFLLPFLFWPAVWRNIAKLNPSKAKAPEKLLICWTLFGFLIFSAMSGKQPHYLLPLMPGFALLASRLIANADSGKYDIFVRALPFILLAGSLAFAPSYIHTHIHDDVSQVVRDGVGRFTPAWFAADAVIFAALFWFLRGDIRQQALGTTLCMALLIMTSTAQAHKTLYPALDLRPFAGALQTCKDKPIAFSGKYDGELGFLARMEKPFEVPEAKKLSAWLKTHPGSCAVIRHKTGKDTGYKILYSQPFKEDQQYSLVK